MSEQSKAPDVIVASMITGKWYDRPDGPTSLPEYLSSDHHNALVKAFAEDASAHLLNTQIAFESNTAGEWVKGNNSGVKACAAVVRQFSPDETQAAYDAAISAARAEGYAKGLEDAALIAETAPYKRGGMICGCSEGLSNWTAKAILALKEQPNE